MLRTPSLTASATPTMSASACMTSQRQVIGWALMLLPEMLCCLLRPCVTCMMALNQHANDWTLLQGACG